MSKEVINNGETGFVIRSKLNSMHDELYNIDNTLSAEIDNKAEIDHNHDNTYEQKDLTILKESSIGTTVQSYDPNTVIDPNYQQTDNNFSDTEKDKLSNIEDNANNYSHPVTHSVSILSDAGTSITKDYGTNPGNLIEIDENGKLPAVDASQLLNISLLTVDQQNALDNSSSPSSSNPLTTNNDLTAAKNESLDKATYDPSSINNDAFSMDNMVETDSYKKLTAQERIDISNNKSKTGISQQQIDDIALNNTHRGLTNNPHSVTPSVIGLGNVNNTSDVNKPLSSASVSALNNKSDIGHTHDYEPSNTNIQSHITDPNHALLNAQPNNLITSLEIQDKLTGEISTHTHPLNFLAVSKLDEDITGYNFFRTEIDLSGDDPTKTASQHAIKTYIDNGFILSGSNPPSATTNPSRAGVLYFDTSTVDNEQLYICTDATTDANIWILSDSKTNKILTALTTNVLQLDNSTPYTPTLSYHPATKDYVDTNAGGSVTSSGSTTVFDIEKKVNSLFNGEIISSDIFSFGNVANTKEKSIDESFYKVNDTITNHRRSQLITGTSYSMNSDVINSSFNGYENGYGFCFTKYGTILYFISADGLHRYNLSEPYNLNSAYGVSPTTKIETAITTPWGTTPDSAIIFTHNGEYFFVKYDGDDHIYKTSTPYIVENSTIYSSSTSSGGYCVYLSDDGMSLLYSYGNKISYVALVEAFKIDVRKTYTDYSTFPPFSENAFTFLDDGWYACISYTVGYLYKLKKQYDISSRDKASLFFSDGNSFSLGQEFSKNKFSFNGTYTISSKEENIVDYLKTRTGEKDSEIKNMTQALNVDYSPNDSYAVLYLNYAFKVIKTNKIDSSTPTKYIEFENIFNMNEEYISYVDISNNGYLFITTSSNLYKYKFDLVNTDEIELVETIPYPLGNYIHLTYSIDGLKAYALYGSTLQEYSVSPSAFGTSFLTTSSATLDSGSCTKSDFSADGLHLYLRSNNDTNDFLFGTQGDITTINTTHTAINDIPITTSNDHRYAYRHNYYMKKIIDEYTFTPTVFNKIYQTVYTNKIYPGCQQTYTAGGISQCGKHVYINELNQETIYETILNDDFTLKKAKNSSFVNSSIWSPPGEIKVSECGHHMYLVSHNLKKITHLILPEPFSLYASYVEYTWTTTNTPVFFHISPAGDKIIAAEGDSSPYVFKRYSLPIPFSLTGMVEDVGQTYSATTANFSPLMGFSYVSPDGTMLYKIGTHTGSGTQAIVYLSDSWDLTTAYLENSGSTNDFAYCLGFTFNSRNSNNCLYAYTNNTYDYFQVARKSVKYASYSTINNKTSSMVWESEKASFLLSPTGLSVYLLFKNIYNPNDFVSNSTLYISRDNGSNWDSIVLSTKVVYENGSVILTASDDFVSGVGGTDVKIKLEVLDTISEDNVFGFYGYYFEKKA